MRLSLISGVTQAGAKVTLRDGHGREGKGKAAGQAVSLGPRGCCARVHGEVCLRENQLEAGDCLVGVEGKCGRVSTGTDPHQTHQNGSVRVGGDTSVDTDTSVDKDTKGVKPKRVLAQMSVLS